MVWYLTQKVLAREHICGYSLFMTNTMNACPVVHMTSSAAEQLICAAALIDVHQLTPQHLDVLQMLDLDLEERALLGPADDALADGDYNDRAVIACTALFNAFARKARNA